jgi:hypothetical protein
VLPLGFVRRLCLENRNLNHVNPNVLGFGQGEARLRNYKKLELGGSQAYDRSADVTAVSE